MSEIDRSLSQMLTATQEEVAQLTEACTALSADEASLESKIENKAAQLERNQKRLSSLMNVRPAFMDEFDAMEQDLHRQYKHYLEQFRNLGYLENELAKYNKKEDALVEEQEHKLHAMRERLRKEELEVIRGQRAPDDSLLDVKRDRDGGGLDMNMEQEEAGRVMRAEQLQEGVLGDARGRGADKVRGASARGGKRQRPESGRPQVKPRAEGAKPKSVGNIYGEGSDDDDDSDADETSSEGALSLNEGGDSDEDDDSGEEDNTDDDDDEDEGMERKQLTRPLCHTRCTHIPFCDHRRRG